MIVNVEFFVVGLQIIYRRVRTSVRFLLVLYRLVHSHPSLVIVGMWDRSCLQLCGELSLLYFPIIYDT